jgi:peptidoglycan/LPS O-acetylase OafA/YrhL
VKPQGRATAGSRAESAAHPDAPGAARRDIRALTGLRAVAATWVVLLHFQRFVDPYLDQLSWLRPLVRAGWTGVELFFVLSGFVITLSYVQTLGSRPSAHGAARFVLNRFARVWPAYAVVTLAMGAWLWSVRAAGWNPDAYTPHPAVTPSSLIEQLTMTQMWTRDVHGDASWVLPGWSISAEWAAYVAFPVFVLLLRPLRRLPAAVLLLLATAAAAPLAVLPLTSGIGEQHWVLRIACGFTAGALAALAYRRTGTSERTAAVAVMTTRLSLLLMTTSAMWAWRQWDGEAEVDYAGLVVLFFPVLVWGLASSDRGPARWLSTDAMVYGGRISYALYLVHFVVLDVCITVLWQDESRGVVTPPLVLVTPLLLIASFVVAAALHHGVEEPCRRWILRLVAGDRGRVPLPRSRPARPVGTLLPRPARTLPAPSSPVPRVPSQDRLPRRPGGPPALAAVGADTREQPVLRTVPPSA